MQIWNLRKGSPDQSFIYLYDGWNGRGFAVRWCNEIICFPGTLNLTAQSTTVWWVWVVAEPPMPKAKQGCISVQTQGVSKRRTFSLSFLFAPLFGPMCQQYGASSLAVFPIASILGGIFKCICQGHWCVDAHQYTCIFLPSSQPLKKKQGFFFEFLFYYKLVARGEQWKLPGVGENAAGNCSYGQGSDHNTHMILNALRKVLLHCAFKNKTVEKVLPFLVTGLFSYFRNFYPHLLWRGCKEGVQLVSRSPTELHLCTLIKGQQRRGQKMVLGQGIPQDSL